MAAGIGLLALVFILCAVVTPIASIEADYRTVYACEGKTLNLECGADEFINLIRANFGRFSITICNEKGNTDWSVNCMSSRSLRVLEQSCGVSNKCSLEVTAEKFGDACPGTFKYIEVHFSCVSAASTTTTKRPYPPWYTSYMDPSLWLTSGTTTRRPSISSTTTVKPRLPVLPPAGSKDGVQVVIPGVTNRKPGEEEENAEEAGGHLERVEQDEDGELITIVEKIGKAAGAKNRTEVVGEKPKIVEKSRGRNVTSSTTTTTSTTTTSTTTTEAPVTTTTTPSTTTVRQPESVDTAVSLSDSWIATSPDFCPARVFRTVRWNYTRANDVAVMACPGGAMGFARWSCQRPATLAGVIADPPRARWSPWPDLSECKSYLMASLEERLLGGEPTLRVAGELAQVTASSESLFGGDVRTAARLVNHLASRQAQQLITVQELRRREEMVTELASGVVRAASNLLDIRQRAAWRDLGPEERRRAATSLLIGLEQNAFLLADNLLPDKTVLQADGNMLLEVNNKRVSSVDDISFPAEGAWRPATDSSLRITRRSLLENRGQDSVKVVFMAYDGLDDILQPLQWTEGRHDLPQRQRTNGSRIVNSRVLSASLGEGRHTHLPEPVQITFKHLITENVSNPTCSFWDYTINLWSEEGCRVVLTNQTHTLCECDHLTSFAVLMDVYSVPGGDQALRIVTYIGCAVAILCLSVTLLVLLLLREFQSDRISIHKNLIFCLLAVELCFLVGLHQTGSPVACGVLAGLMHFFLMAAFAWMFFEAFQLYVTLTVLEAERSRLRWYYVASYGVPLLVVAVSCIVDPLSYGTEHHCWLRTDNYFIFSFFGPAIILFLLTAIFLGLAVFVLVQHSTATLAIKTKEQSRLSYIRSWLREAFGLLFLLVLTWSLGLVFLDQRHVVLAYLFTVSNGLLGLFIFVLYCSRYKKVRSGLNAEDCLLPSCLRSAKTLERDRVEALSTSNGTVNTVLNISAQNKIPRLWSPHVPINPKSATLNSLNAGRSPAGSMRRGTMRSSMPAKLSSNLRTDIYEKGQDSGHGTGSENESPHLTLNNLRYVRNDSGGATLERPPCEATVERPPCAVLLPPQGPRLNPEFFAIYQQQQAARLQGVAPRSSRSHSPHHTYAEVDRDPVYEEIDRHGRQVCEISDEDRGKQSDMSRQSSRTYSDSRPLIPYGVALSPERHELVYHPAGRLVLPHSQHDLLSEARLRDFEQAQIQRDLHRLRNFGENVALAVLNGEQVVCALQPAGAPQAQASAYPGRDRTLIASDPGRVARC